MQVNYYCKRILSKILHLSSVSRFTLTRVAFSLRHATSYKYIVGFCN